MNRGSLNRRQVQPRALNRFNEAPIHESGKFDHDLEHLQEFLASMRPRFMNRGSGRSVFHWRRLHGASMRPRFMNRGSNDAMDGNSSRSPGFNEAPIHESGKLRHAR